MNILLYNPDNEVTNNFMPHLWMFLLQSLTPPRHQVFLVDGNAQRMSEAELVAYVRKNRVELVGIGAMTRMAAKVKSGTEPVNSHSLPNGRRGARGRRSGGHGRSPRHRGSRRAAGT